MNGPQKILAAQADGATPEEMDGVTRIMLNAAASRRGLPDSREACRRIAANAAAAKISGELDGVKRIMMCAAASERPDDMDGTDRIRRIRGEPTRAEEDMTKALSALDRMASALHRPAPTRTVRKPCPWQRPSRASGRSFRPVR
jgi:hypothetical protein